MQIKFDKVRIGKKRKNINSELLLKYEVGFLKNVIQTTIDESAFSKSDDIIYITLIIPARGYNIKARFQDLKNDGVKKFLLERLDMYNCTRSLNLILANQNNPIFF